MVGAMNMQNMQDMFYFEYLSYMLNIQHTLSASWLVMWHSCNSRSFQLGLPQQANILSILDSMHSISLFKRLKLIHGSAASSGFSSQHLLVVVELVLVLVLLLPQNWHNHLCQINKRLPCFEVRMLDRQQIFFACFLLFSACFWLETKMIS